MPTETPPQTDSERIAVVVREWWDQADLSRLVSYAYATEAARDWAVNAILDILTARFSTLLTARLDEEREALAAFARCHAYEGLCLSELEADNLAAAIRRARKGGS